MGARYRWNHWFAGWVLILLCSGQLFADESKLRVLTSIKPLQLITTAVVGNEAQVDVLLDPNLSPHDYQLRPSDRRKLEGANIVFWIGPALETFLVPALSSLPRATKVVALHTAIDQGADPHLWMNPIVAIAIAHKIADSLAELAPTYGQLLQANAARLEKELLVEDRRLREDISALKSPRGYMVVHDAYSRFESRYGIQHRAALTDISDLPPSAQHIARIQAQFDAGEISCVMQEPFGSPKILQTLLKGRQVKTEVIDSLALKEDEIVAFYQRLGMSVRECLQP